MRRPLQPVLEVLLSLMHSVAPLLLKPEESICCSDLWWFQDTATLPTQSHSKSEGAPYDI